MGSILHSSLGSHFIEVNGWAGECMKWVWANECAHFFTRLVFSNCAYITTSTHTQAELVHIHITAFRSVFKWGTNLFAQPNRAFYSWFFCNAQVLFFMLEFKRKIIWKRLKTASLLLLSHFSQRFAFFSSPKKPSHNLTNWFRCDKHEVTILKRFSTETNGFFARWFLTQNNQMVFMTFTVSFACNKTIATIIVTTPNESVAHSKKNVCVFFQWKKKRGEMKLSAVAANKRLINFYLYTEVVWSVWFGTIFYRLKFNL